MLNSRAAMAYEPPATDAASPPAKNEPLPADGGWEGGLLIGLLISIPGAGALLHAAIFGAELDWSSAWTWFFVFGWPILVAGALLIAAIAICALIGLVALAIWATHPFYQHKRWPGSPRGRIAA
jgi:hypothetical protein